MEEQKSEWGWKTGVERERDRVGLGWVVVGVSPGSCRQVKAVFHAAFREREDLC